MSRLAAVTSGQEHRTLHVCIAHHIFQLNNRMLRLALFRLGSSSWYTQLRAWKMGMNCPLVVLLVRHALRFHLFYIMNSVKVGGETNVEIFFFGS
jgi:hypothetical protein